MKKIYLDLTKIFNYRMVYPESAKIPDRDGPASNYIKEKTFSFDKICEGGGASCIFRRNKQGYDNVICNSQTVDVEDIAIQKITIVGLCSWGNFKEKFLLKFSDESTGIAIANFMDMCWPLENAVRSSIGIDKQIYSEANHVFCELDCKYQKGYLSYYTTTLQGNKKLRQIIFPDNCLMNIFAITLEN